MRLVQLSRHNIAFLRQRERYVNPMGYSHSAGI